MCPMKNEDSQLGALRTEIDAAERRVARGFDPGPRGFLVSILVFVLLGSFILPHAGDVRGWDVLFGSHHAAATAVSLPSRVFAWLALVFGVGFSMLALLTRRWALAWVALAGSAIAGAAGMLAIWSRQTAAAGQPGPGWGLIVAWITVLFLIYHWARVVWSRTIVQLAAEEQRRRVAAEQQARTLLDGVGNPVESEAAGRPGDPEGRPAQGSEDSSS
jgi:hypothetical protein